jgi:hypothetical protein
MKRIALFGLCVFLPNLFGAVITSGFIDASPPFSQSGELGTFNLSGSDFNVTGVFDQTAWPTGFCSTGSGCAVGTMMPVQGATGGDGFLDGAATIDGTAISGFSWGGIIAARESFFSVAGPQILLTGPGTYVAPFSFTGGLCGIRAPTFIGQPCLVDLPDLTGSGLATIIVGTTLFAGQTRLAVTDATFTFIAPEPSSFVLAGTTLILLAVYLCGKSFFVSRRISSTARRSAA